MKWRFLCGLIAAMLGAPPSLTANDQGPVDALVATLGVAVADEAQPDKETEHEQRLRAWRDAWDLEGFDDAVEKKEKEPLRSCTITLQADGTLECRIFRFDLEDQKHVPVTNLDLRLVQDGRIIATGKFREEQEFFEFVELDPGIYSLIGYGEDGFLAFALHLASADKDQAAEPQPGDEAAAPAEAKPLMIIETCALASADMPTVLELMSSLWDAPSTPPTEGKPDGAASEEAPPAEAKPDPEAVPKPKPAVDMSDDGPIYKSTTVGWHRTYLREDGSLFGRVRLLDGVDEDAQMLLTRAPEQFSVYFVKDNQIVKETAANPHGSFVVRELEPGIYSLVGVGSDGFLATAIEVLAHPDAKKEDDDAAADSPDSFIKPVSFRATRFVQNNAQPQNFLELYTPVIPSSDFIQLPSNPLLTFKNSDVPLSDLFTGLNDGAGRGGRGGSSGRGGSGPLSSNAFSGPSSGGGGAGGFPSGGGGGNAVNRTAPDPGPNPGPGPGPEPEPVPVPSGLALILSSLPGCGWYLWRRRRQAV